MSLRRMVGATMAGVLAVGLSVAVAAPAHAGVVAAPGSYQTVSPTRVLDTRSSTGPVAPLSTITFAIPDDIIPVADIGSVLLEVTVVNPTARGYATVFGAGTARPEVSNINFQLGQNVPNTVIVKLSGDYKVSIFNGSNGTVNLLADVQGYFQAGTNQGDAGTYVPVAPKRFLDTRSGLGATVKGKVAPHSVTIVKIGGLGGVPADASAVAVNITAVQSGGKGYLTVYGATDERPEVSTVNFYAGENRANLTTVALGPDGTVSVFNGSPYPVDVLADVTGYFVAFGETNTVTPGAFIPFLSGRALDTRKEGSATGFVPPLSTLKVPLFDPETDAAMIAQIKALSINVTAVGPQAAGFMTTWDGTTALPAVSNVNFRSKRDSAGSIVVPLNPDGTISIYNGSFGSVDILVDVNGVFVSTLLQPDKLQAAVHSALATHRQPQVIRQR